ncbi:PP2C family protein-serine/threonine phosphatase [Aeromicrobium sp. CF3.5]|uniref:PP2C family protein-serine/threonine phosphatase n=1 Tax=Aeromicrobium sp. CF3.5 TaxID=3373078 RepID=UPI003EE73D20
MSSLSHLRPTIEGYVDDRIVSWRTGSSEGQRTVCLVLSGLTLVFLLVSLIDYRLAAAAWFAVPMLLGTLTLRHQPLMGLLAFIAVCVAVTVTRESMINGMTAGRISTLIAMIVIAVIVMYDSSHRRSGLPRTIGEAMLVDLRDRLQAQGSVPELPAGWSARSAMKYAGGARFSGDFMVANKTERDVLEMVLVDVCGKGVAAGTRSLQLAGALGGLIGALEPVKLFEAANDFLLRQNWDDGFATAVHVQVDLTSGDYTIISGGHPPALRWRDATGTWEIDGARGLALGIAEDPTFDRTTGTLAVDDALMFYTDGVVESRSQDVMAGIEWLRGRAGELVAAGFDELPRKVMDEVDAGDDRAILLLSRTDPVGNLTQ